MNPVKNNPNAFVAAAAAGPGSQIVLQLSAFLGWTISTGLAIYIASGLSFVTLLIGRAGGAIAQNGIRGCWRRILDGPEPSHPE